MSAPLLSAVVFDWDNTISIGKERVDRRAVLADMGISVDCPPATGWLGAAIDRHVVRDHPPGSLQHLRCSLDLTRQVRECVFLRLQDTYVADTGRALLAPWFTALAEGLRAEGVRLFVASGTDLRELAVEVRCLKLESLLDGVYGRPVSKLGALRRVARQLGCSAGSVVMVDDDPRSVRAALVAGFAGLWLAGAPQPEGEPPLPQEHLVYGVWHELDERILAEKLHTSAGLCTEQGIEELVQRLTGEPVSLVSTMEGHFSHTATHCLHAPGSGRTLFARTMIGSAATIAGIQRVQRYLRGCGLPVPEPVGKGDQHWVTLTPWRHLVATLALPGQPASQLPGSDATVQAARALARLHTSLREWRQNGDCSDPGSDLSDLGSFYNDQAIESFPGEVAGFRTLLELAWAAGSEDWGPAAAPLRSWLIGPGLQAYLRMAGLCRELHAALHRCERQLILGDYNRTNILLQDGEVSGMLDLEDLHHGPPEIDVLTWSMWGDTEPHPPQDLEGFCNAYDTLSPGRLHRASMGPLAQVLVAAQLARHAGRLVEQALIQGQAPDHRGRERLQRIDRLLCDLGELEWTPG